MDIIFDADAAFELLMQMDKFCSGIVKESKDLLEIASGADAWDDVQKRTFANGISEMTKDLNVTLAHESEYMNTFKQRIMELRG